MLDYSFLFFETRVSILNPRIEFRIVSILNPISLPLEE